MLRNLLKLRNNFFLLQLSVAVVVTASMLFILSPPTYAVSTDLQLEIDGIECNLEAIYGNNDPSTVIVPSYCNNAPEPSVPAGPGQPALPSSPPPVHQPVKPSFNALLLNPQSTTGLNAPIQSESSLGHIPTPRLPYPDEKIFLSGKNFGFPSSFVEGSIIVAIIIATALVISIAASGFFGRKSYEVVKKIKSWLSKLHK